MLWFGVPGDGPHILSSGLLRNLSQHSLFAFFIALFRALHAALTSSLLAVPLFLLLTRPRSFLLSWMSSFHHLLDLAQMVITRTCSSRTLVRMVWIYSISLPRSSTVQLSASVGCGVCNQFCLSCCRRGSGRLFICTFILSQTGLIGHGRAPQHLKGKTKERNKGNRTRSFALERYKQRKVQGKVQSRVGPALSPRSHYLLPPPPLGAVYLLLSTRPWSCTETLEPPLWPAYPTEA